MAKHIGKNNHGDQVDSGKAAGDAKQSESAEKTESGLVSADESKPDQLSKVDESGGESEPEQPPLITVTLPNGKVKTQRARPEDCDHTPIEVIWICTSTPPGRLINIGKPHLMTIEPEKPFLCEGKLARTLAAQFPKNLKKYRENGEHESFPTPKPKIAKETE